MTQVIHSRLCCPSMWGSLVAPRTIDSRAFQDWCIVTYIGDSFHTMSRKENKGLGLGIKAKHKMCTPNTHVCFRCVGVSICDMHHKAQKTQFCKCQIDEGLAKCSHYAIRSRLYGPNTTCNITYFRGHPLYSPFLLFSGEHILIAIGVLLHGIG